MVCMMEEFRKFLELSTIHGLYYVSTARKLVRFAWILVIIAGSAGAAYLINQSFKICCDNPVITTIETQTTGSFLLKG